MTPRIFSESAIVDAEARAAYLRANTQTDFEKRRGINRVERKDGFAQIQITGLQEPLMLARLDSMRVTADAGVSIDFLKFGPSGLSFLVHEKVAQRTTDALTKAGLAFEIRQDQSVVIVHAVNIRDEEGLIARIIQTAIDTGTTIHHLGDMHDRLLLVVTRDQADPLMEAIQTRLMERPA